MNSRFASLILVILLVGCAAATCAYFWELASRDALPRC
jgi:hypothetical protein